MRHSKFGQFELRRGEPLQQLRNVSAAVGYAPAMAMYKTTRPWEDLKRGAQVEIFFRIQLSIYVSKNKNIYF
jgi:hypothetical protein